MTHLLIVETRTPLDCARLRGVELALDAAADVGAHVTLWLFQDATQLLQLTDQQALAACTAHPRIAVYADAFAMVQRGVDATAHPDVTVAGIDLFTEHLLAGDAKPVWH